MNKFYFISFFLIIAQPNVWSQEVSLPSTLDTYINSGLPTQSFGSEDVIQIKHTASATAERIAWIKFSTSGITKQYTQVLLKLHKKAGDVGNITLQSAKSNFAETNTWNNPPVAIAPITYGGFVAKDTVYFDVTKYVNSEINLGSASVAFQLYSSNYVSSPMKFASRENSVVAERPQLQFYNVKSKNAIRFTYENTTIESLSKTNNAQGITPVYSTNTLDQYGGWADASSTATGYFRTEKDCNGTWHLIDPLGNMFYSTGLNSIEKGGGIILPQTLKDVGINSMGCWSDESIKNVPYCPQLNLLVYFKRTQTEFSDMYANDILPVFEPEFKTFCDQEASQKLSQYKNDPWVLGYFLDNELPFYKAQLKPSLGLPSTNQEFQAADAWMKSKYGNNYSSNQATASDDSIYQGYVADTYFKITSEAVHKYDSKHLLLGTRYHGYSKYIKPIMAAAGKYMDVISINYYGRFEPEEAFMDMWLEVGKKPFIISEFYTIGDDTGLANDNGGGQVLKTQQDRAKWLENFTLKLMSNKANVGYHWFRYIDNNATNKGLYSADYKRYEPLAAAFSDINKNIYALRSHVLYGSSNYNGAINCDKELCGSTAKCEITTDISNHSITSSQNIVRPNPSNGTIYIEFPKGATQLTITTIQGKIVLTQAMTGNQSTLEINNLSSGMYILQLNTTSGNLYAEKIIVQ